MGLMQESSSSPSRRTVVAAAGAGGLAATLAACGGSDNSGSADAGPSDTGSTGSGSGDSGSGDSGSAGNSGKSAVGMLAKVSDIPEGGGKIFKEEKVVVTQPTKGDFKAFSSICTHQGCSVGSVADGVITCPCHGSQFSIEDGSVKHPPASRPLASLKVQVSGDEIKLT